MQPISKTTITQIKAEIDKALKEKAEPHPVAAVDADGTLWSCDLGEALFDYQVQNRLLPDLPTDPWRHYQELKKESLFDAYLWLAQINAGYPLSQIQDWAQKAVQQLEPVPIFKGHQEIIQHLHRQGVEVYIVTASVEWAVQPAASLYNIKEDHVVGISTLVKDGIITDIQDGPITYHQGKVDGLLERTSGRKPIYAAGNTEGDLPLLQASEGVQFVLASAHPDNVNYETERNMIQIAQKEGWFVHDFLSPR